MANTTPNGIYYPTTGNLINVPSDMAAMATSIENALGKREGFDYTWANSTERTAETSMTAGSRGYQQDTKETYYFDSSWVVVYKPRTAWTPVLTNINVGSGGTAIGSYELNGSMCTAQIKITLGTSPSVSSAAQSNVPINVQDYTERGGNVYLRSSTTYVDTSAGTTTIGAIDANSSTSVRFRLNNGDTVTGTAPFSWANGDIIYAVMEYRYR